MACSENPQTTDGEGHCERQFPRRDSDVPGDPRLYQAE